MSQNVQEDFLNDLKKNKVSVTVFLINGVKLQGIITWYVRLFLKAANSRQTR